MTTLTLTTVVIVVYGMVGSWGYGRALALGGATAAGAALVVGTTAVPTFYAVALAVPVALAGTAVRNRSAGVRPRLALPPGAPLLVLFLAWTTLVTVVSPVLFDGTAVLAPGAVVPGRLNAGSLTTSNIAQVVYLGLGVCVVIFLGRSSRSGPELIGLAAGLTTLLSLWRYLHDGAGLPFPEDFFDNSPAFAYIDSAPGGLERFRGILSEPAGLAVSSLVTVSYMLPRSLQLSGRRRWAALLVGVAAAYLGVISTSATFVVAGGVTVVIAVVVFLLGFLLRRTSIRATVSVVGCIMVIASVWVLPTVASFVEATINEKVVSSSFNDRSSSNTISYDIFVDTFGFGVGLGSNRASSFFPGLLSTVGLVGTLLFVAVVVGLIQRSAHDLRYRPVMWALVGLLIVKVVSGPDLSDSSGILWMSLGVLSRAAGRTDAEVVRSPHAQRSSVD
jgi:hypothetical protein